MQSEQDEVVRTVLLKDTLALVSLLLHFRQILPEHLRLKVSLDHCFSRAAALSISSPLREHNTHLGLGAATAMLRPIIAGVVPTMIRHELVKIVVVWTKWGCL
jgi:hypothetical protein